MFMVMVTDAASLSAIWYGAVFNYPSSSLVVTMYVPTVYTLAKSYYARLLS
jgi:hypothetical protein